MEAISSSLRLTDSLGYPEVEMFVKSKIMHEALIERMKRIDNKKKEGGHCTVLLEVAENFPEFSFVQLY